MFYIMTMTYVINVRILECEDLENGESWRKIFKFDFYRGWYLLSNGTISNDNVVLVTLT